MIVTASLAVSGGAAVAQTGVVQQNNVSVAGDGASTSVTVSGQTIIVQTSRTPGRIVGDGQPASETRPIPAVNAISVDGAFAVTVKTGSPPSLVVATDRNLLPIVKTEAANGRLEIYTDRSYSVDGRITVTVTSPQISRISASGSNQLDGGGLSGEDLSIVLNGSNHAALAGKVAALTVEMSGSNRLSARPLDADAATVTISGSGNASVSARQRIAATISGAGSVAVYGNPKERRTEVNGAGKITFAE